MQDRHSVAAEFAVKVFLPTLIAAAAISALIVYVFASVVLGWASLQVFPASFLSVPDTRIAALIGVPLACGLAMAAVGGKAVCR